MPIAEMNNVSATQANGPPPRNPGKEVDVDRGTLVECLNRHLRTALNLHMLQLWQNPSLRRKPPSKSRLAGRATRSEETWRRKSEVENEDRNSSKRHLLILRRN